MHEILDIPFIKLIGCKSKDLAWTQFLVDIVEKPLIYRWYFRNHSTVVFSFFESGIEVLYSDNVINNLSLYGNIPDGYKKCFGFFKRCSQVNKSLFHRSDFFQRYGNPLTTRTRCLSDIYPSRKTPRGNVDSLSLPGSTEVRLDTYLVRNLSMQCYYDANENFLVLSINEPSTRLKANFFIEAEKFDMAIPLLRADIGENPESLSLVDLAICLSRIKNYKEAEICYLKACEVLELVDIMPMAVRRPYAEFLYGQKRFVEAAVQLQLVLDEQEGLSPRMRTDLEKQLSHIKREINSAD